MSLTGPQRRELKEALISAFPSRAALEQMLRHRLGKVLGVIVAEGSLDDMVFALIERAEAEGWTSELVAAALWEKPNNEQLRKLAPPGGQRPASAPARAPAPPNNLPPQRRFVGREGELRAIDAALNGEGEHRARSSVTLYGVGGIGKTAVALAYAYREQARYPGGIWWLSAEGDPNDALSSLLFELSCIAPWLFSASLREQARSGEPMRNQARIVALLLQKNPTPSLLILDDVDSTGWNDLVPSGEVRVLVTTRDRRLGFDAHNLLVDPISLGHSLDLAHQIAGAPKGDVEQRTCRRALIDLGGLPVAVETAALAVTNRTLSWIAYDRNLRSVRALSDYVGPAHYSHSVFTALDRSIDRCEKWTPACRLLRAVAWFAPDSVPLEWACDAAGLAAREASGEEALSTLRMLGLIRDAVSDETISLHPLVHLRVRSTTPSDAEDDAARRGGAVITAWLQRSVDPRNMVTIDARRPHIERALAASERRRDVALWLRLAIWFSRHLHHRACFEQAKTLLMKAQQMLEARPQAGQAELIDVLSTLGMVLNDLGCSDEALPLFERARALAEQHHGADPRTHALILANLGLTLRALERPVEALPLLERAKEIFELSPGEASSRYAVILAGLGTVLGDLGRPEEARGHFERSLYLRESAEPEDDPKTALILAGLALVLHDLGERKRAGEVAEQAIDRAARAYGSSSRRVQHLAERLRDLLPARSSRNAVPSSSAGRKSELPPPSIEGRTGVMTVDFPPLLTRSRRSPKPFQARLEIVEGPGTGKQIFLGKETVTLGRDSWATLPLADDAVSLHHAIIAWTGWVYALTDLGSGSGTLINGERIDHRELTHGDRLRIGATTFAFTGRCLAMPGSLDASSLEMLNAIEADDTPAPNARIPLLPRVDDHRDLAEVRSGPAGELRSEPPSRQPLSPRRDPSDRRYQEQGGCLVELQQGRARPAPERRSDLPRPDQIPLLLRG